MKKIDFHVHIHGRLSVEKMAEYLKGMMVENGYDGIGIMSLIPSSGDSNKPESNGEALKLRAMLPGSYAFAGIDPELPLSYGEQAKLYYEQGFDGIKLIEGKPNMIKRFGYGADDPRFDDLYAFAEEKQFPILIHVGDPEFAWDLSKATPRMIERGWVYDETNVTFESGFEMIKNILARYPKLKIAFAHMGFMADRLDFAADLLDRYPGMMLDMTPALPIYKDLSATPEKSREFLIRYQDRLLYGTDAEAHLVGEKLAYNRKKVKVITHLLEGTGEKQIEDLLIQGLSLPEEVLKKIYAENAIRWCGEPK